MWKIAVLGDWHISVQYHFQPALLLFALFYKILPYTYTLIWLQTIIIALGAVPLYRIAELYFADNKKTPHYPFIFVVLYFLYFGVEYNTLFDFHADHVVIPLMLQMFYLLTIRENSIRKVERNPVFEVYDILILILWIIGLMIKEPYIMVFTFFGLYMIIRYRMYMVGGIITVGSALFFIVLTNYVLSGYTNLQSDAPFGFLGSNINEIIINLIMHPWYIVTQLNIMKLVFIAALFGPFLFLPVLSPLELLPVIPLLIVSLLSALPNYYSFENHYTAGFIAPVFVAAICALRKLTHYSGRFSETSAVILLKKHAVTCVVFCSLFFHVLISPSPFSRYFWVSDDVWLYHKTAYRITNRDVMIKEAISQYIPDDPDVSVCTNSWLNSGRLARRMDYFPFPYKANVSDYVVLDTKRPGIVLDKKDQQQFDREFELIKSKRKILFLNDGLYILN